MLKLTQNCIICKDQTKYDKNIINKSDYNSPQLMIKLSPEVHLFTPVLPLTQLHNVHNNIYKYIL